MPRVQVTRTVATRPPTSAETVTVACKIPNGLLLRLQEKRAFRDPLPGGGSVEVERYVVMTQDDGDKYTPIKVKGPALPWGMQPDTRIIRGARLTHNVNKAFWERWLEQNRDLPAVRNHQIWAHSDTSYVIGQAKEQKEILSGLEPLNVSTKEVKINGKRREMLADPRIDRPLNLKNVSDVAPSDANNEDEGE